MLIKSTINQAVRLFTRRKITDPIKQAEAERQRQIMAVLQREKEVFARMQKDSAQIRHKEQFFFYFLFLHDDLRLIWRKIPKLIRV